MQGRVRYLNHQEASIDDYHEDFALIWARDKVDRSVFDLWLHVVDHASRIGRAVRRQRPPDVIDDVADTTVWLMSFIAHCRDSQNEIDRYFRFSALPSEIIWNKYPGVCPACFDHWVLTILDLQPNESHQNKFRSRKTKLAEAVVRRAGEYVEPQPCWCLTRLVTHQREQEIISSLRGELDELRLSYAQALDHVRREQSAFNMLESMFHKIYANVHTVYSLEHMTFHLLEEVGEATQALKDWYTYDDAREPFSVELRERRKLLFLEELADVFSWLFAVTLKIEALFGRHADEYRASIRHSRAGESDATAVNLSFATIIWAKYGRSSDGANWANLICPGCMAAPCNCSRDLKVSWGRPPSAEPTKAEPGTGGADRDLVFISYSHQDAEWLSRLTKTLRPIMQQRTLSVWDDRSIRTGQMWRAEIESALSRAKVAVLLVSTNFLASDFINENELPPLLEAARTKGTMVVWFPISASLVEETEIWSYQAAHSPDKPLDSLSPSEQAAALVRICQIIKEFSTK